MAEGVGREENYLSRQFIRGNSSHLVKITASKVRGGEAPAELLRTAARREPRPPEPVLINREQLLFAPTSYCPTFLKVLFEESVAVCSAQHSEVSREANNWSNSFQPPSRAASRRPRAFSPVSS